MDNDIYGILLNVIDIVEGQIEKTKHEVYCLKALHDVREEVMKLLMQAIKDKGIINVN